MRRLIIIAVVSLFSLLGVPAIVHASHYWDIRFSTPSDVIRSKTFNLEYTTLSVDPNDDIMVELYQNGSLLQSQTTIKDYGDSGAFTVTVPADGTYQYQMVATNGAEPQKSVVRSVNVQTAIAQSATTTNSVTQSGNQYAVNFTVPAGSGATKAEIYASTDPNFVPSAATLVGTLNVTPGQNVVFNYSAPDNTTRYFAVRYINGAGEIVGETGNGNLDVRRLGGGGVATNGTVAGTQSDNAEEQEPTTESSEEQQPEEESDEESNWWPWIIGLVIAGLAAGAYYMGGTSKASEPSKKPKTVTRKKK